MRIKILLLALCLGCFLLGCIKEPEGPAEQIGRGIDQITKGIQEYDRSQPTPSAYQMRREEYEKKREDELLRRKKAANPNYDPYWDEPSAPERDYDDHSY